MTLYVYKEDGGSIDNRRWCVYDNHDCIVIARFQSHRAALNFALWKSGLLKNYGGA